MNRRSDGELNQQSIQRKHCLMVQWQIQRAPVGEVRRGMQLISCEGVHVGVVAAVLVNCESQTATDLLLCNRPNAADYRLIPIDNIARINTETIYLTIYQDDIETLAVHHTYEA